MYSRRGFLQVCHDLQIFYSIKLFCKISWNFQESKCYCLFVIIVWNLVELLRTCIFQNKAALFFYIAIFSFYKRKIRDHVAWILWNVLRISPKNQLCFYFTWNSSKPFLEKVVSRRKFFFTNRLLQILLCLWQKI